MSKTYRIEIFTRTAKGKTNHIDNVFISSEADRNDVQKYYAEKYKPLSVSVSELEVVDIQSAEKPEQPYIEKINDNIYSDPEYRIDIASLPSNIKELLTKLDGLEKEVSEVKSSINKELFPYFSSGGSMSSRSKDSITVRGYIRPMILSLNKKDEK